MSPLLCDKCHAERTLKGVAEEQRRQEEEEEESRALMEGEEKEWGESTATAEEEEEGRECRKGQTACRLRPCRCPC